jgi:hypothetical protein
MSLVTGAVRVAGTGECYYAPEGTSAPTDAATALPVAWKGLGYTSTDGVQFTFSRDTNDINAWQGSKLRVLTNAEPVSFQLTLLETKTDTLLVAFGGGTVVNGNYTPPVEGDNAVRSFAIDTADSATKVRYYFPRAQVSGDVSFNLARTDAVGYALTFGVLANTPKWRLFSNDTTNLVTGS